MKFDDRFEADMFDSRGGVIRAGLEDLGVHGVQMVS